MPNASALHATVVAMVRSSSANQVEATRGGGLIKNADPKDAITCPAMTMPLAVPCSTSPLPCKLRQRTMVPIAWHQAPEGIQGRNTEV